MMDYAQKANYYIEDGIVNKRMFNHNSSISKKKPIINTTQES